MYGMLESLGSRQWTVGSDPAQNFTAHFGLNYFNGKICAWFDEVFLKFSSPLP